MTSNLPQEIRALAERVVRANVAAGRRVAVAESCTGGLVAAALTEIPGSSAMFDYGYVTYADRAKVEMLGVSPDLLDTFGSVSVAVAWAMAQGALARSHADVAVAISGIAGPDGGSAKKPVGTVVFARADRDGDPEQVMSDRREFGADKDRAAIRAHAVICALELLLPPEPDRAP